MELRRIQYFVAVADLELMLDPKPAADGHGVDVEYDYVLDPA